MITTRQFFARRNLAIIFTITISILLASSVGKGQSVGPNVDECTGGIVDSNTGVEQTVCLYGDASGITGSVEVDDWGGGNSWYWADQVGASGYINSTYINDQCCGGNENVSGSITPQLNTWEYLTGYYDEEVCDQYYNCNWSYGNYGLSVAVEVTGNPPPAPTGLTATAGGGQATLSWTSSSSATSYNVYMGSTSGGEGSSPIFTGITGTSYTVGGLTNGTTYFFEVAAVNSGGTSGLSNEASATPFSGPPSAPTGLTASPGNSLVALSWSASPGATSYNVYRGTSSGGEGSSPIATGITVTAFSSTGVSNGTSYYFRVAAVNSGGTSGYSNEASATPTSALPNGYSYSATYDPVGNVATYNDSVMGSWTFGYDPMNRLKSGQNTAVTGTSAQFLGQNLCWSYDSFGNRTMQALQSSACPAQSSSNSTWVYNANNQVSGVIPPGGGSTSPSPYTYDSAGDVTVDLTTSNQYLFDPEGRICAVRSPNGAGGWIMKGYLYDAEGVRVAKGTITTWGSCDPAINGAANLLTNFYALGPGDEQLTETDGSGNWQHANVWAGGKLLATYDTTGLHFYMDDLLGSRRVQATTAGVTEHDCLSGPYGDFESCLPTPTEHLFTGKERDTESGNDYFKYRYLASSMGRWLSPDPSGLAHVDLSNPQELNLYSYVGNRPLTFVDLEGLCWKGFQWACNIIQRVENRFEGYGFQTDDQILRNPNKRSQRKIQQNREESYRRETQPAPSLPKPGTPGYIDLQLQPGPYLGQVTISAWKLTPMPPRLDPQDCLVPDAKGYHQNAMLAWEMENGLPLSPSGPSDVNGGEGVSATYVQMKGGSSYPEKVAPSPSEMVPNASAGEAAGANNAAVVAAAFAEFADCEGTR